MRVLILHSELAPDAPDERAVMARVAAAEQALTSLNHQVFCAPFRNDEADLREAIAWAAPQAIFNLAEIVDGTGAKAHLAPRLFELINISYTGAQAPVLEIARDKIRTKEILLEKNFPTPSFALPPDWKAMDNGQVYIVKSVHEDGSLGIEDASVARGWDIPDRASAVAAKHGGAWFAEEYMPGREFQVCLLANVGGVYVLPIAEMRFVDWAEHRPRIVGYRAKHDPRSSDAQNVRSFFGCEKDETQLAQRLTELSRSVWDLFALKGYARIDFRLDADGAPMILEINPNPRLAPDGSFAEAAFRAGLSYPRLIERICEAAADL